MGRMCLKYIEVWVLKIYYCFNWCIGMKVNFEKLKFVIKRLFV